MHITQDRLRKVRRTVTAYAAYIKRIEQPSHVAFDRAGGDVECKVCGGKYFDHPEHPVIDWLHILCDGRLVKL